MNIPLRVIGKDITYQNKDVYLYIDAIKVVAAYPMYAVKDECGQFWRALPSHENAELVSFKLKYIDGNTYVCGNESELEKIGLSISKKSKLDGIGFIQSESSKEKLAIDCS